MLQHVLLHLRRLDLMKLVLLDLQLELAISHFAFQLSYFTVLLIQLLFNYGRAIVPGIESSGNVIFVRNG
jgi:hypothetical protein